MVHKKSLALLISGIASATASAAQIARVEYTDQRTEFAQEYTGLFGEEPCDVWKQDMSGRCARSRCDHGSGRTHGDRGGLGGGNNGGNNGGGNKGGGNGNSGGGNKGGGNSGGSGGSNGGGGSKGGTKK